MGDVSYDEFLFAVRGEVNERRSQVILQAFEAMDKDNSGAINSQDMKVIVLQPRLDCYRFSSRAFEEHFSGLVIVSCCRTPWSAAAAALLFVSAAKCAGGG